MLKKKKDLKKGGLKKALERQIETKVAGSILNFEKKIKHKSLKTLVILLIMLCNKILINAVIALSNSSKSRETAMV